MESLSEPIQVVVLFRNGRFEPLHFKWNGRQCRVKAVTGKWATREGQYKVCHFAVTNENGTYFEISLNTNEMTWTLERVIAE